ncbi:DUF3231 family protein [Rossellomorea aquimaris]|uniref:DUF3231 family protein n=1 Tax=Rossellomorea aquimaris TaxID=189382 RepID=A0A5D4UGY9_9BACI|nr:DUF3231 family protein [Rossellomorea aquimaris]TYS77625.1 DUF3231 family protein [Rossellomorea aquimaris]TYS86807.1 DUF3231 family protein [Rossellomorea aquimaris]
MSSSNRVPITSSELANLWMTYQDKTMIMRFLEYFLEHVEQEETRKILQSYYERAAESVEFVISIFQQEGAVIPAGFTENDVNKGAPKLFDYMYDVMYLHMMSKLGTALYALYSTMSYRQDIRQFFRRLTTEAQEAYDQATNVLLEAGVLSRSPYVSMPKEVEFVREKNYMTGLNWFSNERSLNTIEISLIHNAIETNLTGMQLMIGFAQVAHDQQVRNHFVKGMELSKKVETSLGEFLRQDYIEPPATHAGKATNSTVAPFSDKLMMYNTSLLTTFGLGSNALGGAFSLRTDLPAKMALLTKDIFDFAKQGGIIMIKNGWMEKPPQVEDRNQLIKR